MAAGNLVTLEIMPDGLHIKLEPNGREYLDSEVHGEYEGGYPIWHKPHDVILWELLEPDICNGTLDLLNDNRGDYNFIGALTSAPIIAYDVERNGNGELIGVGRVFWYPQYAVSSELEELCKTGEVIFQEGK